MSFLLLFVGASLGRGWPRLIPRSFFGNEEGREGCGCGGAVSFDFCGLAEGTCLQIGSTSHSMFRELGGVSITQSFANTRAFLGVLIQKCGRLCTGTHRMLTTCRAYSNSKEKETRSQPSTLPGLTASPASFFRGR